MDCRLRTENDRRERLAHLRGGADRLNGKRQIGRQMRVRSGTYKRPVTKWLDGAIQ